MKILITGANGFIGRQIVERCLSAGHHIVALSRSVAPSAWLAQDSLEVMTVDLMSSDIPPLAPYGIDCVIHLAISMIPDANVSYDELLSGTKKLIDAMHEAKIKKLVGMSSLSVVDFEFAKVLAEIDEDIPRAERYSRMGSYSALKAMQEKLYLEFAHQPDENCVILRPGLVYDTANLSPSHAGVVKSKFSILGDHPGFVPVVELGSVVEALKQAAESNLPDKAILHLVDDVLPSQQQYHAALLKNASIKPGSIHLHWLVLSMCAKFAYLVASVFKLERRIPDIFLPHAFATRLKPFRFSNRRAKQLLHWQPKHFFISKS